MVQEQDEEIRHGYSDGGHKRTQMSLNGSSSWARSSFKLNSFPHPFLMILLTQGEGTAARITHKAEGCVANLGYLTQRFQNVSM